MATTTFDNKYADLAIMLAVSQPVVAKGEYVTYAVNITNLGNADAWQAIVTSTIPSQLCNAEVSTDLGLTWHQWQGWINLDSIPAASSTSFELRAMVLDTDCDYVFITASICSLTPDPDISNNTFTAGVQIIHNALAEQQAQNGQHSQQPDSQQWLEGWDTLPNDYAVEVTDPCLMPRLDISNSTLSTPHDCPTEQFTDLSIVSIACPLIATICQPLTYTLVVCNQSGSLAEYVVVIDDMTDKLMQAHYSLDDGKTWRQWTGRLLLGTMQPYSHQTILINGTVSSCVRTEINNTAVVLSKTKDSNCQNNRFWLCTRVLSPQCC